MKDKMTLEELVDEVNKAMASDEEKSTDKRFKEVTERRARDYISKGILSKSFKEGRNAYYGKEHYDELLKYRQLQKEGLSERNLQSILKTESITTSQNYQNENKSYVEKNELKENAQSVLNSLIMDRTSLKASVTNYSNHITNKSSITRDQPLLQPLTYDEYVLDSLGEVKLMIQKNKPINNPEEILEKIKHILNIGDQK